jgi:hypothetical protein
VSAGADSGCGDDFVSFSEGDPARDFRRRRRAQTSNATRARKPRPTPTPMPTFTPVLRPPPPDPSVLSAALCPAPVGVEVIVVIVGVPLTSVDEVVFSAAVLAGDDPLLPLPPLLLPPPVSAADSVLGRNPPCQSRVSPVALGRLTTFARLEAS